MSLEDSLYSPLRKRLSRVTALATNLLRRESTDVLQCDLRIVRVDVLKDSVASGSLVRGYGNTCPCTTVKVARTTILSSDLANLVAGLVLHYDHPTNSRSVFAEGAPDMFNRRHTVGIVSPPTSLWQYLVLNQTSTRFLCAPTVELVKNQ